MSAKGGSTSGGKQTGEWGEFFPTKLSPFAYNETVAQEYMPLTKTDCQQRGWSWQQTDLSAKQSSEHLCTSCSKPFKVIPQEARFYTQLVLPVPQTCPDCRHRNRLQRRNPRKLWQRPCTNCQTETISSYAPDRKEIVYCETCYRDKMY
jgi:hypothetical protein